MWLETNRIQPETKEKVMVIGKGLPSQENCQIRGSPMTVGEYPSELRVWMFQN